MLGVARKAFRRVSRAPITGARHSENGAAFVEFALVVPVIVMIFTGLFDLSRSLAQVTWLVQTTFNAAYYGAGNANPPGVRDAEIKTLAAKLFNVQNKEFTTSAGDGFSVPPAGSDVVRVRYSGDMRSLVNSFLPLSLNIDFTLPVLVQTTTTLDLNNFQNPTGGLYNCDGVQDSQWEGGPCP